VAVGHEGVVREAEPMLLEAAHSVVGERRVYAVDVEQEVGRPRAHRSRVQHELNHFDVVEEIVSRRPVLEEADRRLDRELELGDLDPFTCGGGTVEGIVRAARKTR
jgi:hypothetical protein